MIRASVGKPFLNQNSVRYLVGELRGLTRREKGEALTVLSSLVAKQQTM